MNNEYFNQSTNNNIPNTNSNIFNPQNLNSMSFEQLPKEEFNNNTYIEQPKNKSNKLLIIITIILIFIIAIIGILSYLFTKINNPKNIFNFAITESFNYLTNIVDNTKEYTTINNETELKYNFNYNSEDEKVKEMLNIINNIDIKSNYSIDIKNKLINMELSSKYKNKELLDLNLYTKDNIGYILLKDIYPSYLSTTLEEYNTIFETNKNKEETKIILQGIKEALLSSIKEEQINKQEKTITLNNKDILVTDNYLTITPNNINRILINLYTSLYENKEFIKAYSKITETEYDLEELLLDEIKELKEEDSLDYEETAEEIIISIYTKKSKKDFIGFSIKINDTTKIERNILIEDNIIYLTELKDNEISSTVKLKINNDNIKNGQETNINIDIEVPELFNLKIALISTTTYNSPFKTIDIKNSKDIKDLTNEDNKTITDNFFKNKGIKEIIEDYNNIKTTTKVTY